MQGNLPIGNGISVHGYFIPAGQDFLRGRKGKPVPEQVSAALPADPDRAVDLFDLQQSAVRRSVRENEPVDAEIAVVQRFAEVTAVSIPRRPVRSGTGLNTVVAPFPHAAAKQAGMPVNPVPVGFRTAGAVSHGMKVFAHEIRTAFQRVLKEPVQFRGRGIHDGNHIQGVRPGMRHRRIREHMNALVMGQAGAVPPAGPEQSMLKGDAVTAFVSHGPEQNAGPVDIPFNHPLHTVQDRRFIIRPVRQQRDSGIIKVMVSGQ